MNPIERNRGAACVADEARRAVARGAAALLVCAAALGCGTLAASSAQASTSATMPTLATPVATAATVARAASAASAPLPAAEASIPTSRGPVAIPQRSKYAGINLSGIAYYSTELPFVDLMKSGMGWTSQQGGVWGKPSDLVLRPDGYPASLKPGQQALTIVASRHYPLGRYVILWEGDGSISFPLNAGKVVDTRPHRIVLELAANTGPMWMRVDRTNPADPVRNVRYLMPGTESTYQTQPFNPEFLQKVAPFSVLRFMDWGATNGSRVAQWADRPQVGDITYGEHRGVPLEVMIALANTLHVDPWFCIPHQASDDYVRRFAALLKESLHPSLKAYIEYSNEVWNRGFEQGRWALEQSKKLGLAQPSGMASLFYAQRSTEIFRIMQQAYGPADRSRLVRVIAGQSVWTQFLENALGWKDTAAQADVMAIAPYFGASGLDDAARPDATLALSSDEIVDRMLLDIRGSAKKAMTQNAALARKYRLRLMAYEGGSSAGDRIYAAPADKHEALVALYTAAHRNPRMQQVYREYFETWVAAGGETLNQFNDIGSWSKWGFWSLLEAVDQDPATAPRYRGVMDFIAEHPGN